MSEATATRNVSHHIHSSSFQLGSDLIGHKYDLSNLNSAIVIRQLALHRWDGESVQ